MELEFIGEAEGILVSYDQDNEWLYADWYGPHTPGSAAVACQLMLNILAKRPCAKVLNDNTNITNSSAEITDSGWQWMKDMYEAGVRCFAWVQPSAAMDQQISESALRPSTRVFVATFSDMASAYSWLERQAVN